MNEVHMNKINGAKKSEASSGLDVFLSPGSVAVIGASERPGSWGSFIMGGLLSRSYSGKIYPVNPRADQVFGIPVLIGSHYNPWESQTIYDLNKMGIRVYNRLHEITWLLAALRDYTIIGAKHPPPCNL